MAARSSQISFSSAATTAAAESSAGARSRSAPADAEGRSMAQTDQAWDWGVELRDEERSELELLRSTVAQPAIHATSRRTLGLYRYRGSRTSWPISASFASAASGSNVTVEGSSG
jgi:hypothetical protein